MSNYRDAFLENTYYHVVNKSFNNNILLETSNDYRTFVLTVIDNLMQYPSIKIISYCILPDHFHFVLYNEKRGFDISNLLKKIQITYAIYYKKKNIENENLKGLPVFVGRFKSQKLDSDDDIEEALSYVNYNPIHHELVESIGSWPYSSIHQFTDTGYVYEQEIYIKVDPNGDKIKKNYDLIGKFEIL